MKQIYLIREMKLIGATFKIYNSVSVDNDAKLIYSGNKLMCVQDSISKLENCRYYQLSDKPEGYDMDKIELLPYFATVTEDIPSNYNITPKVYERCQLTTQYPNNYFIFRDTETGKDLKISMNSHTYQPLKQQS